MAKKAYIGVPSYKVVLERNMTYSSGDTWSFGNNTTNEVNWTKGETYVCDVTIDGVTYPNLTFSPDVGASWFAVYPETGTAVFEVYVATNNQFYDYGLGLDTKTSHTILISTGNFNGTARKIKKGYVGVPTLMNVPTGRSKYNNMDLPTVPAWNSTTYPYAYISYSANEGYRFLVCSAKLQYVLAQGKCTPVSNASYMYVTLWNKTTGTWDSWSSVKSATANSTYLTAPSWANTAIPYSDNSNTLISATEPTVLYEEKEVGVARKIKKAYIGIGGKARPCWSGGELAYYGTITNLSSARYKIGALTIGSRLLMAGGGAIEATEGPFYSTVDTYNSELTKGTTNALSVARINPIAAKAGSYGLFAGGYNKQNYATVDAYDSSLTRSSAPNLSNAISATGNVSVGDYAIFAYHKSWSTGHIDTYNGNLTHGTMSGVMGNEHWGASTKNHAIIVCSGTTWAFNTSLTKTVIDGRSVESTRLGCASTGERAIFAGGQTDNKVANVYAYNSDLTRTTLANLSAARSGVRGTALDGTALFVGGENATGCFTNADAYSEDLVHTTPTGIGTAASWMASGTVGNYLVFAGGTTTTTSIKPTPTNKAYAYTVV